MNRAKHCWNVSPNNRIRVLALAVFILLSPATAILAQTPILRDALQTDSDGNSKTNAGDRLKYTLTFTNTSGVTLTNVLISVPAITNTTLDGAATSATPLARDEGPAAASVPGNAFHTAFNTPLAVNDGDVDEDLLNNDFLGATAAAIATFGGGTLGGSVGDNSAGATANPGGAGAHSLTVNANGSFTYTPATGFAGLFTFQYRLANASGSDTATVVIAVGERPSAVADARAVTGNVQIDTATGTPFSVLSNDDGDAVTINVNTAGTLGAVNMSANGQFVYTPPRGKSSGTDTFSYTLQNGFGTSSPATVTLNFDGNIVWFIDASAGAGDGRSHLPYNTLAAFNAVNDGGANNPADNQVIILRDGTYNHNVAGGALLLRNGQRVFGDGWSGAFDNTTAGFSLATHSVVAAFSGTDPLIQNSTGHGIALLAGNHLRGLTVGNTPNGFGYSGAAVASPVIAECSKTGTGGAISISTSGAFASSVSFDILESTSSSGANLALTGATGTLDIISGGAGLAGSAANSSAVNISGGSVSLTYPGTVAKVNAGSLVNVSGGHTTGTLTFTGTMSATSGDGLQFNNADGIYNFNATVTLNGGDTGVDIINGSAGNFTFNDANITNPTGPAFLVNGGNGTISHTGTISKNNAGRLVEIQSRTGGSVTLAGNLSSTGTSTGILCNGNTGGTTTFSGTTKTLNTGANTAISLTSNTGATINFTGGGLALTTTTGSGFSATGGGTVSVTTGANNNTVASTTGIAVNIVNTTIGASGVTFRSVAANGASSGMVLNNTGGSGGLTVTGDAGGSNNGSGGTIQNTTGAGVSLTSTINVNLGYLNVQNSGDDGISGTSVTGFAMNRCNVTNNGNALNEDGVDFGGSGVIAPNGLFGTAGVTNSVFTGNYYNQFTVRNGNNTANLTMIGCTFNGRAAENNNNDGLFFEALTTATITATVTNSTFAANKGDHFQAAAVNSGNLNIKFKNNALSGGHSTALGQGITVNAATGVAFGGYLGRVNYEIDGNTITNAISNGIIVNLGTSGSAGTFNGFIRNNIIGNAAVANSGSTQANGIAIDAHGNGTHTCLISGNIVRQVFDRAITVLVNDGTSGVLNLTVQNNNLAVGTDPLGSREAFFLNNASTTANVFGQTDAATVRLDLGGAGALANTLAHGIGAPDDFRLRQRFDSRIELPGYAGTAFDTAAVIAYVQGRNTGSAGEPGSVTINNSATLTTDGFFNGTTPLPTAF